MAIDTAEKRRSAAGVGVPYLGLGVTPNASQDQEWRQQAAWSYSGILADAPSVAPVGGDQDVRRRRSPAGSDQLQRRAPAIADTFRSRNPADSDTLRRRGEERTN